MRDTYRLTRSADDWFKPVNKLWERDRKSATMSLWDRCNYQQGIIGQSAESGYLVLYNAAGSNIASCVLDTTALPPVNNTKPQGFILDHTAYWYRGSLEEAHFVSALLNAPCVDLAIKIYQTRGLFGARHIHRRPFEVCGIPEYDANNSDHQQLAALSQAAHVAVATLDLSVGGVVAARKQARTKAQPQIAAIDAIAQRLLGLTPAPTIIVAAEDDADEGDVGDEELPE